MSRHLSSYHSCHLTIWTPGTAKIHGSVSVSGNQLLVFKITFWVLTFVGTLWLVGIGALLYSMRALNTGDDEAKSVADGAIYMSILALALVLNVAIIVPACLLLQPFRLWRITRSEKESFTPRQRFRGGQLIIFFSLSFF